MKFMVCLFLNLLLLGELSSWIKLLMSAGGISAQRSETTRVSTIHHSSILEYHAQMVELTGNGGWQLYAAGDYRFKGNAARVKLGTLTVGHYRS